MSITTDQSTDRCGVCRFYEMGGGPISWCDDEPWICGSCQRYPPQTFEQDGWDKWPRVSSGEWCGEFNAAAAEIIHERIQEAKQLEITWPRT